MKKLHELCSIFPKLDEYDFNNLVDSIRSKGLIEPITLSKDGLVLDGQNRYLACLEAGIEPRFVEFDGDDLISFVLSKNMHRRHLSKGQQAAIISSMADWENAHEVGSNQHSRVVNINHPLSTIEGRSEESGASRSTQKKADAVSKADPDLVKKVARGEVSLEQAVKQVAPQLTVKPKPEYPLPTDGSLRQDGNPTESDLLLQMDAEIVRLQGIIESLSGDDKATEILRLNTVLKGVESRLGQEMNAKAEAIKSAKYYKKIIDNVCKLIKVDDYGQIASRVKELVQ